MTIELVSEMASDGESTPVKIKSGQYYLGAGGEFSSGTMTLWTNIGPNVVCPVTDINYTEAASDIIWLPNCTVYVKLSGSTGSSTLSVALSEVSTKLDS